MRELKNEKGAITILVLISILFMVSFLISSYVIIANKVKTQKEVIEQTRKIYEEGNIEDIYINYFSTEIIPIYNAEQLIRIGSDDKYLIGNKYYELSENATYILMDNISFDSRDFAYLNGNDWIPTGRRNIKFEGNGKEITVTNQEGIIKKYNENNKYKYYANIELATNSDYITNGLTCWLDGSENSIKGGNHNSSTETWTDISNNNNNAEIYDLRTWGENYIFFGGTSYAKLDSLLGTNRNTNFTVEVIYSSMNYQGMGGVLCSGFGSINSQLRLELGNRIIGYNTGNTSAADGLNFLATNGEICSFVTKMGTNNSIGYYYLNGESKGQFISGISPTESTVEKEIFLGKSSWGYQSLNRYANCKIYAVRIYNRQLTDEEIQQNYEVDKQRFSNEITYVTNESEVNNMYNNIVSYKLANDIDLGYNTTWIPIGRSRDIIDFDGNGKEITVTTATGGIKAYNENNEYKYAGTTLATESDYVTSGLKCWLDGIQNISDGHSTTTTTWADLSGNNKYATMYNLNSTGSGWYEKYIQFNGTNSYATIAAVLGNNRTSNYTVEVVFDSDNYSSSNQGGVFVSGFGYTTAQLRVQLNGVVNAFGGSNTGTIYSYPITNSYNCLTFAVGTGSCNFYVNGQNTTTGTYAGISPSEFPAIYLGLSRSLSGSVIRYGKVKIYAVRIYNRALSEEEILQNYNIDVERFGLQ